MAKGESVRVKRDFLFSDMQGLNKYISHEPFPWKLRQHKGINQGEKRDPVYRIQYRTKKEFLRMTTLLVSLENKQPILKRTENSWKKLKLIF